MAMKAAIYARKSTDDNDRDAENKSVARQVERGRAYARAKGWTLEEEHIYVDDGIRGAEFKKRPALLRLLIHVKEFDVIIMSELSRLGREQSQTSGAVVDVYAKGRRVFFNLNDEEVKFKSAVDKFMINAVAFGAELEREKASQRSRDALERKAAKGYNAGGACYGYDNVQVHAKGVNGEQVKSHTDYRVNEEQAEAIRGIFRAYADGHGHTTIAKALNGNGSECGPKGKRRSTLRRDLDAVRERYFNGRTPPSSLRGKRGTGSWAPSAVREILYRERYAGKVPFAGSVADRRDLRIVDDALWQRAQQRLKDVKATYIRDGGQWWGRPSTEKYLLTGMGRCTCCGKSLAVIGGWNGSPPQRRRVHFYGCSYFHTRGRTICTNDHRARMESLDGAVLQAIEQQVLKPEAIAYTIEESARIIEQELRKNPDKPRQLEAEARKMRKELDHFMRLIAEGRAPESVLAEIRRREERLEEVQREQQALEQIPPSVDVADRRRMCRVRPRRFQDLLLGDVPVARQALRKLLPEALGITPVTGDGRRTLSFEGGTKLGPLFDLALLPPAYKD